MDPAGSELDASLPQSENPCLIVEDSQPDSVALEDDPEGSYRAVLARRLSSLQPSARSPVLVRVRVPPSRSSHACSSRCLCDGQYVGPSVGGYKEPSAYGESRTSGVKV